MRIDPKTIIRFTLEYFDSIRDLFDVQLADGIIRKESASAIYEKGGSHIEKQLQEYRLVRNVGGDFELRPEYFHFLKFVLEEFRPLLPEHIEKYNHSITELFRKIREEIYGDVTILNSRIKSLAIEVREFVSTVEHNTLSLLEQTRALKANADKIDYREKVQRASYWIDYYILPLNRILDVSNTESIIHKLYNLSEFVNNKRLNFHDKEAQDNFEQLYIQLLQTNDDLLKQSKILTNELLPLIERIRTESRILTGFITYLRNPYKTKIPSLFKRKQYSPYSSNVAINTKAYMEQFMNDEAIIIDDDFDGGNNWIFNKDYFKEKLKEQLPVENFFNWCNTTLKEEYKSIETDKLFALTTLLFEEDLLLEFDEKNKKQKLKTKEYTLQVPTIAVSNHGIF